MSNLVPEKRLDSVGKLVTRWVKRDGDQSKRKSILGTVIPTIPETTGAYIRDTTEGDKALWNEMLGNLKREIQKDFENQPELVRTSGAVRAGIFLKMQNRLEGPMRKMRAMETSTLQALLDAPCKRYSLIRIVNMMGDVSEL